MIFSPFLPSFFTSNIIKRSVVPISDFFWVPKLHVEASPFTYIYISPLLEQMIHSQNSVTFIENIIIMYCIYNHIYIYILCYHGNHLMWLGVSSKIQLLLNIPPAGVQRFVDITLGLVGLRFYSQTSSTAGGTQCIWYIHLLPWFIHVHIYYT